MDLNKILKEGEDKYAVAVQKMESDKHKQMHEHYVLAISNIVSIYECARMGHKGGMKLEWKNLKRHVAQIVALSKF